MRIAIYKQQGDDAPVIEIDDNGYITSNTPLMCKMNHSVIDVLLTSAPISHEMLQCEKDLAWYNKILAIKSVRGRTGLGLKEAKDIVDKFMLAEPAPVRPDYRSLFFKALEHLQNAVYDGCNLRADAREFIRDPRTI